MLHISIKGEKYLSVPIVLILLFENKHVLKTYVGRKHPTYLVAGTLYAKYHASEFCIPI